MTKKIYSWFRSNIFWCVIAALVLLIISYYPIYVNYQRAPHDLFYYGMADEYPIDTTWNLGLIRQGYNGHLESFLNISSTLPASWSFVKMEYTTIGMFARLLLIDPLIAFHIARFITSLLFFYIIYRVIAYVWQRPFERVVAYILVLFGTSITISPLKDFVATSVMDALVTQRLTTAGIHYLLGGALTVASLYFLSRVLDAPTRTRYFIWSVATGALASLINAPGMVLIVSSLPLYFCLIAFRLRKNRQIKKVLITQAQILFSYALISGLPILYVRYVMTTIWGPYSFSHTEELNPFHLTVMQYILTMGATYVFSIIATYRVWKDGKTIFLLILPWIIMHPVGEYILPVLLHINRIRYFLLPYYVGFGMLATVGLFDIARIIQKYVHTISTSLIAGGLLAIVLLSGYYSYQVSYNRLFVCFCNADAFAFGYPKKTVIDTLSWLSKHSKEDDVILSGYFTGNLIPAFSGNVTYTSWWHRLMESPGFWDVGNRMESFYSGNMTQSEAAQFIKTNTIRFVLYSPTEHMNPAFTVLPYQFLVPVYQEGDTILYRVR
ncbi:MAG TPA: hypothetical protein VMR81_05210 [Patescibacteria group bacterium]|nr:hypothetical protein [Patescibacteria group bacterium]